MKKLVTCSSGIENKSIKVQERERDEGEIPLGGKGCEGIYVRERQVKAPKIY